jgi:hypothetical protein
MEQKSIKVSCWNCKKVLRADARLDEVLNLKCKCGISYCGPAREFSRLPKEGYQLSTPGKKSANVKGIKIVLGG